MIESATVYPVAQVTVYVDSYSTVAVEGSNDPFATVGASQVFTEMGIQLENNYPH